MCWVCRVRALYVTTHTHTGAGLQQELVAMGQEKEAAQQRFQEETAALLARIASLELEVYTHVHTHTHQGHAGRRCSWRASPPSSLRCPRVALMCMYVYTCR